MADQGAPEAAAGIAPVMPVTNISADEKNLAVSFIQFIRQKVSSNQCSEDQVEAFEGEFFACSIFLKPFPIFTIFCFTFGKSRIVK